MGAVPKLCLGVVCVTLDCEVVTLLCFHVCFLLLFVQVGKVSKMGKSEMGVILKMPFLKSGFDFQIVKIRLSYLCFPFVL